MRSCGRTKPVHVALVRHFWQPVGLFLAPVAVLDGLLDRIPHSVVLRSAQGFLYRI